MPDVPTVFKAPISKELWTTIWTFSLKTQLCNLISCSHTNSISTHSNLTFSSHQSIAMATTTPPSSTGSAKLDAVKQQVLANTPEKLSGLALYSRFAFAGAVCCAVTHGGMTPVDV